VSEATAIEVAVGPCVVLGIVNLWELQTSIKVEVLSMEVLMGTENLDQWNNDTSLFYIYYNHYY
jgi:hypothetical protein